MASEPNEWYDAGDSEGTMPGRNPGPDFEALVGQDLIDYLNALEARVTRAKEHLQVVVEGLKEIANGDAERWQWTDANPDMQSYYFIKAGEDIMRVARETLAKLDADPTEVQP